MEDSSLDLSGQPSHDPEARPGPVSKPAPSGKRTGWILVLGLMVGLAVGGAAGFGLALWVDDDIRRGLAELMQLEQRADVESPQEFDRELFTLRLPGNWKVRAKDVDYNPDTNFAIDSPAATSSVGFQFWDQDRKPEELVEEWVKHFAAIYDGEPSRTKFQRWGELEGVGVSLQGTIGLLVRNETRIFAAKGAKKVLLVWEEIDKEERRKTEPGFELIRSSFRFKPGRAK